MLVIRRDGSRGEQWICKCDCGAEVSRRSNHLRGGKIVSCGCHRRNVAGNNTRKSPYEWLYTILKRNSKRSQRHCSLTFQDFLTFTSISKCHYCGDNIHWPPYDSTRHNGKRVSHSYYLDRKDNALGYTKDNCVVCCPLCNYIKGSSLSYPEMVFLGPYIHQIKDSRKAPAPIGAAIVSRLPILPPLSSP